MYYFTRSPCSLAQVSRIGIALLTRTLSYYLGFESFRVFGFELRTCVLRGIVGYFAMSNEAPIEGYVDPSIPNPNGEQDAPIIIYGYVEQRFLHRFPEEPTSPFVCNIS